MLTQLRNHAKHAVSSRITGDTSAPFHWFVNEPWDQAFLREYRRARSFDKKVDSTNLRRIWILSYSCSGTHSFYTHFHYMPVAFSMGENTFIDKEKDPHQLQFQADRIKAPHWLFGSAFNQQGLQMKNGARLSHLFLLSNHYLKFPQPAQIDRLADKDRMIFYQRNFIRVLYSQDRDSRKFNKPHFTLSDQRFEEVVNRHRKRVDEMVRLTDQHPEKASFCFHEKFCAAPERVINEVCDFVEIKPEDCKGWNNPEDFFTCCYRNGLPAEKRDSTLYCPTSHQPILGKGGQYNPVPPISLERTISAPIREWLSSDRKKILEDTFGVELVDFWLNDDSFDYQNVTTKELSELLSRSMKKT